MNIAHNLFNEIEISGFTFAKTLSKMIPESWEKSLAILSLMGDINIEKENLLIKQPGINACCV